MSPSASSPAVGRAAVSAGSALRYRSPWAGVAAMIVLGLVAVGASLLLAQRLAESLRASEQALWEQRLAAVARQQRDFLQQSGDADLAAVADIPQSPTIGLFLTEYRAQRGDFDRIMDGVEQLDYIRNYLTVVAAEHGYQTGRTTVRANLPAMNQPVDLVAENVDAAVDTTDLILREFAFEGIALVNLSGDVIVSTDEFPPLTFAIREFIATAPRGERHVSIAFDAPDGRPAHVSLQPAFAYLDVPGPDTQLAWVVGLRLLEEVFDTTMLGRLGVDQHGIASVAVHRSGDSLRALSRLDADAAGGAAVTAAEAPHWALAMDSPGTAALLNGPDGRALLTASASFDSLPVSIVTSIPAEEAFYGVERAIAGAAWLLVPVTALAVGGLAIVLLMARHRRRPAPVQGLE